MLLSEAAQMWLAQRRSEGFSQHTLKSYQLQTKLLVGRLGDIPVEDISLPALRDYIASDCCSHLKASSLAHRVRVVKSLCRWLHEEEYITRNPSLRLKEPKQPARIPKALPFEDLELLRDACKSVREHALIEVLFATGCRANELAGIQRSDVDWERRAIIVMGKGSKEREVYFGARAAMWLRRYLSERRDACPYLFSTVRGAARPVRPHLLWYLVKGIANRVGLGERVWPHVMRHTLATTLLNHGADIMAVQTILGHQNPKTTQVYAHLSGESRQAAYRKHFVQ